MVVLNKGKLFFALFVRVDCEYRLLLAANACDIHSLLLDEFGHVKNVGAAELLLHLIELVSTDSIKVSTAKLLLELSGLIKVVQVLGHAGEVILDQSIVLAVCQVCMIRIHRLHVFLGCNLLGGEPHALAKIVGHISPLFLLF